MNEQHSIEVVYVGSAGHLRRYKVVDGDGRYVPGGLFRTWNEAQQFILSLTAAVATTGEENER